MSDDQIESFIESYRRQENYYRDLAQLAAGTIERELEAQGIRAIVTFRPKSTEKLRAKLELRSPDKQYKSHDAIRSDIRDLSGVRVALYFPSDADRVAKIVASLFEVHRTDNLPKLGETNSYGRFPGYCATHYTITIKSGTAGARQNQSDLVELQIATVFMHAWAEVEHDLRYKPTTGEMSDEELLILEQLNGLALSAEAGLKSLQAAIAHRAANQTTSIQNHFELAALILRLAASKDFFINALPTGRADILFYFLEALGKLSVPNVTQLVELVKYDENVSSIVDPIVDALLATEPNAVEAFAAARERTPVNPYESANTEADENLSMRFLRLWELFGKALMYLLPPDIMASTKRKLEAIQDALRSQLKDTNAREIELLLTATMQLRDARNYRNDLVHRGRAISPTILRHESDRLVELITLAAASLPQELATKIRSELKLIS